MIGTSSYFSLLVLHSNRDGFRLCASEGLCKYLRGGERASETLHTCKARQGEEDGVSKAGKEGIFHN